MSVTIDRSYLSSVAPEFNCIDSGRLETLNTVADCWISETVFGDCAKYAKALVIAHMANVGDLHGKGAVSSESVGDLSRSYATPKSDYWNLTSYGSEFLRLAQIYHHSFSALYVI